MAVHSLLPEITEDSYENIVTNLPFNKFSIEDIKELYYARWGIETSFYQLKHILSTENFHFKKRECIAPEICCSIITNHVVIRKGIMLANIDSVFQSALLTAFSKV